MASYSLGYFVLHLLTSGTSATGVSTNTAWSSSLAILCGKGTTHVQGVGFRPQFQYLVCKRLTATCMMHKKFTE